MPEGTEGITNPGNTGTETQTPIDVVKLSQDLKAAQEALAEKDKQYRGLQTTYNTLYKSNAEIVAEKATLAAEMETLQNQISQAQGNEGTFQQQIEALKKENETLQGNLQQLETAGKRSDLILKEYPDLLPFEQKGLLPEFDGDEDAFKGKLDTFKEALSLQAKEAVDDELSGSGPDLTGGDNSAPDRDKVMDEMLRIAGDPNKIDRYRELQSKLDEIDTKKG